VLQGDFGGFDEAKPARLGVTSLGATDASDMQWFSLAEPLGIVHPLHAWDEGDVTVLWTPVCRSFDGSSAPSNSAHMAEIELNRRTGAAKLRMIDQHGEVNTEFGRMHPGFTGRKAQCIRLLGSHHGPVALRRLLPLSHVRPRLEQTASPGLWTAAMHASVVS